MRLNFRPREISRTKIMPSTAIGIGALLIVVGVAGYVIGTMGDRGSVTALIPAFIGVLLLLLGLLSNARENLRKHLMHAAILVALLGFIATAGRLISRLGELTMSPAVLSQAATAVLCLVFVILA